jgi:hypothetical protein
MKKLTYLFFVFAVISVLAILVWNFITLPNFSHYESDFSYAADIISKDNFYNSEIGDYSGEILSDTKFSYEVIEERNGVLSIKNIFDVRKVSGEKIFAVERLYGVDSKTGKHVSNYGDKNRSGYLFAPRGLKGQPYTYWHINYDNPANLVFRQEETVKGLKVHRYEANFKADQTDSLGHLPGVPDERGVDLDVNLQVWVEPISGHMVKYEDNTIAFYYDKKTGERIHPWNKFTNTYTNDSIERQVKNAQNQIQKIQLIKTLIPILIGLVGLASLIGGLLSLKFVRH